MFCKSMSSSCLRTIKLINRTKSIRSISNEVNELHLEKEHTNGHEPIGPEKGPQNSIFDLDSLSGTEKELAKYLEGS